MDLYCGCQKPRVFRPRGDVHASVHFDWALYENFVSQLDIDEGKEKLDWLGKMDAGSLKLKVASSIVAISSIHLLRMFMDAQKIDNDKLLWYVIIHMTFVVSAFAMAYVDKLTKH